MNKKSRLYYVVALSRYIRSYRTKFILAILVNAIYMALPIVIGMLTSYIISSAVMGNIASMNKLLFGSIFLVLVNGGFYYLDIYVAHDIAYRVLTELRNKAYEKVDEIAPAAMEGEQSGNLVSIIISDIEILEWFYAHSIAQWVVALLVPLFGLLLLGYFSLKIPAVLLPFILLLYILPVVHAKKSNEQGKVLREELGNLHAMVIDGVQGLRDIISFRSQKQYFHQIMEKSRTYDESSLSYARRSAKESRSMGLIVGLASLSSQIVIILATKQGEIDPLWILPLFSLCTLVFKPIIDTVAFSRNYGMLFAAARRLFDLFQMEASVQDHGKEKARSGDIQLSFRDVYFRYPSKEDYENPEVLRGINFCLETGETVALVSESGGGKSTVAKLIQRFWDVDKGEITIEGKKISQYSLDALRRMVTGVPQDVYLFNRSIKENLLIAKPYASEEELHDAAQEAQILDTIERLEEGWETVIGERGLKLSGGEKQRLALAQALLAESPILILDEASSSLDVENEKKINRALDRIKKGRLCILIAHRINTIKGADRILYIREGKVEAQGSFEELMQSQEFQKLMGSFE